MPRFYLIDDEIWTLADMEALLRQYPIVDHVCKFTDGRQALNAIVSDPPDVVFTDLRMDRMSGRTLISAIREHGLDIPIVIISAYSDFEVAREALSFGVFDYLLKPVSRDSLQKMMARLEKHLGVHTALPSSSDIRREVQSAYPECRIIAYPAEDEEQKEKLMATAQEKCMLRFDSAQQDGFAFAYLSNPAGHMPQGIDGLTGCIGISRPQKDFEFVDMMRREAQIAAQCGFCFAAHARISEIQSYLAINHAQALKLDELAAHFYMNKTYLCEMFKKECGVTVVTFLRDIRMAVAAQQLRDTGDPIQQIASSVGYPDSAYFTRVFRSLYGVSPEVYRRLKTVK